MESKAHYKKCLEKSLNPQTTVDDGIGPDDDRSAISTSGHSQPSTNDECDTLSDGYSDGDGDGDELEIDMESSGKRTKLLFLVQL